MNQLVHEPVTLWAETAAELMTANPMSIRATATVREAVAFLTDKGFSAAPVIDEVGRPVGVLSRADIVVHDREKVDYVPARAAGGEHVPKGFQVENVERTCVQEIMTPTVFSVRSNTPARKVIEEMVALRVHRLFVVDPGNVLVGVISAMDVLRHLRPGWPAE